MRESWAEWFDRHSRTFFIAPAVTLILIFAIFPTFYSIVFALSRVKFSANGLRFRFVGLDLADRPGIAALFEAERFARVVPPHPHEEKIHGPA